MATFRLEITPVTPLHIGSGEELPGYNYYIEDGVWYVYHIEDVLGALDMKTRNSLLQVATDNIMGLTAELATHAGLLKRCACYVGQSSAAATAAWRLAAQNRSQALVQRFLHGSRGPYVPGSSLKGALRTALLFACMQPRQEMPTDRRAAAALEAEVFQYPINSIGIDPLRFLKIGDSNVLAAGTTLRTLVRWARDKNTNAWQEQVAILAECTPCALEQAATPGARPPGFAAQLTLAEDSRRAAQRGEHSGFAANIDTLLAACRMFYGQHLWAERNFTKSQAGLGTAYRALLEYAAALPPHAALIRLGFGAGRDSVTVNTALPAPEHSRSRQLVDNQWPLGWAELRVLTPAGEPFTPAADVAWPAPKFYRKRAPA